MSVFYRTILPNLDRFAQGILVTMEIATIAFFVAIIVGIIFALIRMYIPFLKYPAELYIQFARNCPIYVQLIWVAYVWPELFGWPKSFFVAGWTALALQSSGYLAEIFRAGIEGIDKGMFQASYSLGMSKFLTLKRIVLPQVFLTMSPSIMNQFVIIIKSSTLVSVIAIPDLMYEATRLVAIWFEPIEIYTFTGLLYIVFLFIISNSLKRYADKLRSRYV